MNKVKTYSALCGDDENSPRKGNNRVVNNQFDQSQVNF